MNMENLVQALSAASQANKQAEHALEQMESTNRAEYAVSLAKVLSTEGVDPSARILAGLAFKNMLVAKNEQLQADKIEKWKTTDSGVRMQCKQALLAALLSPTDHQIRMAAAQAASQVAAIELPYGEWSNFVSTILDTITSSSAPDGVKVSSLQCLGFTCERLAELDEGDMPEEATNSMLTAIVDGMQKTRSDDIRTAAAMALRDSLFFSQSNMERKPERDAILQNVVEAAKAESIKVRLAAYYCLVQLAMIYYEKLGEYMTGLYQLTVETIENDQEEVAVLALEFWMSICEMEMELIDEAADLEQQGLQVERRSNNFVSSAVQHLVPILLGTMTKQDEEADLEDEQNNVAGFGATCLSLVAQTVEDLVVPCVMPFVTQNIQNQENWRYREAAIMAFASILEGPAPQAMRDAVGQSIPVFLGALSDSNALVRESAAYAIAKICEMHVESIPAETLPTLVSTLLERTIKEAPRAAYQGCSAIHSLANEIGQRTPEDATTNALSSFMPDLLTAMFQVVDRPDAGEHSLRETAMETISMMVDASALDMKHILLQLLPEILNRLKNSFSISTLTNEDKEKKESYQGYLCGTIQSLCLKLTKEEFHPFSDQCMALFLEVLQSKNASSHTEVFAAISVLVNSQEEYFVKYMPAFQPFLIAGLKNYEAYQVCKNAVSLVGDIARAIEKEIQPYCADIMTALVETLRDTSLHRSVKPPVFMGFGDIALAIEAAYEPFVEMSMLLLMQACNVDLPDDDEEMIDYVNELREGILEGFTGIITGLRDGKRLDLINAYVSHILEFLRKIESDQNRSESVLSKAIGLLGDVASAWGPQIKDQINQPYAVGLITEGRQSGDENIIESANWAGNLIQQVIQSH